MEFSNRKHYILMSISTQEVLKYINLAREYPKYYVALIDEQINSFIDDFSMTVDEDIIYETIEGKTVWEEAKEFLIRQEPLRPFDLHQGLAMASADHARDIVKNNSSGHQGSDGSTFIDRVQRYCKKGKSTMIELIGTTCLMPGKNSLELAMLNLIIDDGVTNRGHRKALFSKDYKYIGPEFILNEEKIYTVISLTEYNLEVIKHQPQSIATSTSHLKTMTELQPEAKVSTNGTTATKSKENIIDSQKNVTKSQPEPLKKKTAELASLSNPTDQIWTLKNVHNDQKVYSKKSVSSRQNIQHQQPLTVEPSIFKQVQNSVHSKSSIAQSDIDSHKAVYEQTPTSSKEEHRSSKRQQPSLHIVKENSLKSSQSIKSQKKENQDLKANQSAFSSKVQQYKPKSSNSPFFKSQASSCGFGSTAGNKKIVEKKETMRTWNEDEFLVKEVTTILKYDDGTIQDFVEKHSVLKTTSNSYIKDASL